MKNLTRILLILFALSSYAQDFDKEKLDKFLDLIESNDRGMGSLAISKSGNTVYQKAIGYSSVEEKKESDPQTQYRIGSVSKTFTATIIMQLIQENKLTLETKLAEYFPEIPNAEEIAVEHLLRHRSGIFNITSSPDFTSWMTSTFTKDQLLRKIKSFDPVFSPDDRAEYSNSNYILLTFITEEIEKDTYKEILSDRIVSSCSLERTKYGDKINEKNNEAFSYSWNGNWSREVESDMSIPQGAGGIISTPSELNDFLNCLFTNELVTEESLKLMTKLKDGFGLGLLQVPFYSKKAFGHNGGIDGFQTMSYYFPKEEVAVAYISNGTVMSVNDLLIGVLSIYFGMDYQLPRFIDVDKDILKKYEGTYSSSSFPMDISIFVENGILKAQATGQPSFPLEAVDETTFKFSAANVLMTFQESGKMRFEQRGAKFELSKK